MKAVEEAGVASPAREKAVEVVLTHSDHTSTTWARRMKARVQVQGFGEMHNTELWRTLLDGKSSGKGCARQNLDLVPDGTMRHDVDILLSAPDINVGGILYLFDISRGL